MKRAGDVSLVTLCDVVLRQRYAALVDETVDKINYQQIVLLWWQILRRPSAE